MTDPVLQRIAVASSDPFDQDFVVETGRGFDGVGLVTGGTRFGSIFGTGSLLGTGQHVLTAAHVVEDFIAGSGAVRFDLPEGSTTIGISEVILHPDYSDFATGNDIAIVVLESVAPVSAERYEIFRGSDEVGQVNTRIGYGIAGNGTGGEVSRDPTAGDIKRSGQNIYDADGAIFNSVFGDFGLDLPDGTTLGLDFDDGTSVHDAFGAYFGLEDTGLGAAEANSTSGDSGGPVFIDGRIAGITSFGLVTDLTDANGVFDAGFGEFSGDTRVSAFANWIDSIAPPSTASSTSSDGDDSLIGSRRSDILTGGLGHDTLSGGEGDDVLYGNKNTDILSGGAGDDTLFGGQNDGPESANSGVTALRQGVETLYGGSGEDVLYGNHGAELLLGEDGADSLYGGQEGDTLLGGLGDDRLFGNLDDDVLSGGGGDDLLHGGAGNDTASYSGARSDYVVTSNADGSVTVSDSLGIEGEDTLFEIETLTFAAESIAVGTSSLSGPQAGRAGLQPEPSDDQPAAHPAGFGEWDWM